MDTNGDDIIDFTTTGYAGFTPGQGSFSLNLTYSTPWVYKPVVTVTDGLGNVSTHNFVIKVYDPVLMNQMFTNLWARMLDKLRANDIPAALTSITGSMRDKYQTIFTAIQPNLATVAGQLGTLTGGTFSMEMAEYFLVRTNTGGTQSYPLYFIRGEDGVWRIDGM